jgi:superfamily II DNA or RNA helicase
MSCKKIIDEIEHSIKEKIQTELQIKVEQNTQYNKNLPPKYIFPYEIYNDNVYLPFSYAYKNLGFIRPKRETFSPLKADFIGTLRPEQKVVKKEAISLLNKNGNCLISCYPGFGKTAGAIELATYIGIRTIIIVNKIILLKQWETSIKKFCPQATIQIVTAKSEKKDVDFYIINAINVCKLDRDFFKDIGLVVVDECHMIMSEVLSKSLQYISPRYLIGLSATPYRPDGLDILIELYFGKDKIIRNLYRKHIIYKIKTGITPTVELANNGRINWGVLLDSQANDKDRNELIIKIIKKFRERTFLVLSKRVSQASYLVQRLLEEKEDVTSLIGSNQEFQVTSRILIATSQKCGVGFDHPSLNTLIIASDLEEYFIQYLGRIFRTEEVEPIIFDLVDNNGILEKHFNTRKKVYEEVGGKITNYELKSIL